VAATVGIRREDKSRWERRVPITPEKARELHAKHGIDFLVQPSPVRVFREEAFERAGVRVEEDLSAAGVVFGVKEIPLRCLQPGKTYIFFAHVTKGQPYNMAMLRRMMELGCNLIDYEKVTDERGHRLIFFGWHAGVVSMVESLWALGERLRWEGIANPFSGIRNTYSYDSLAAVRADVRAAGERIKAEGLPAAVTPLIVGVAGYGNVGRGIKEMLTELPAIEVEPHEVQRVVEDRVASNRAVYSVLFKEEDIVAPNDPVSHFDLQDYYQHPDRYHSTFERYLPHLSVLMNANYWDERYPRLVTKAYARTLYAGWQPRLRVIGDASCDIEGSIECTLKATEPDDPVYVYEPASGEIRMGVAGRGPVVLAVDILPSELPREASEYFSEILEPFIPGIAGADYSVPFEEVALPSEIARATILYHGKLTPDYRYLADHVATYESGRSPKGGALREPWHENARD
jgi:saccharopine dehydrogenase (NAD+, L-lysine-forming)